MTKINISKQLQFRLAVTTFLLVNFLFFIDEGYYNFKWMTSIGNWVAFVIYFSVVLICQLIFVAIAKALKIRFPNYVFASLGVVTGLSFLFYWLG